MKKFVIIIFLFILLFLTTNYLYHKALSTRKQLQYANTFNFQDATLSYKALGNGKPVILLHGSMYSDPWKGFDKKLAETYKVYVPDMPGFGASDAVQGKLHNTDLFSDAFCAFLKETRLEQTPIVCGSLGTITALKASVKGCTRGELILVGMPGSVSGWEAEMAQRIPLVLKRLLISTRWGKEKLLIPALKANIGEEGDGDDEEFIRDLKTTDPRSLVDINYKKEVEQDLPKILPSISNKKIFIYGELDPQKDKTKHLIEDYITIPNAVHNIFRSEPNEALEVLKSILGND